MAKLFDEFGAACSFCIQDFKVRIVAAVTHHSKNSLLGAAAACHVLLAGVLLTCHCTAGVEVGWVGLLRVSFGLVPGLARALPGPV